MSQSDYENSQRILCEQRDQGLRRLREKTVSTLDWNKHLKLMRELRKERESGEKEKENMEYEQTSLDTSR